MRPSPIPLPTATNRGVRVMAGAGWSERTLRSPAWQEDPDVVERWLKC
jgi:hypothetical protein